MTRKADGAVGAAPATNPAAAKVAAAMRDLRAKIDKLDLQILDLINKRAATAGEIGKLKNEQSAEIFSPAREEEVLQNVLANNKGPLDETTIRAVYREIISGSRALQRVLKVAFLGPNYSYSHLAAIERFGQAVEMMGVSSIAAVFEEVNRRHADYGVVPLENSTDGRVADTLEQFIRLPQLRICSEVRLRVHHNLLANCEQTEIRRVYSKTQALSQCRHWLAKNVPQAQLHEVSSTAIAADLASKEKGAAAIASHQAAVRYGLRTLFVDIEDSPFNETRFAVIGPSDSGKTGNDKTAVMFKVSHSPGSLLEALAVFKENKVNLTWIESFPYRTGKNEYVFFADFEGHADDPKVKRSLTALREQCETFTVLGSFPAAPLTSD